MGLPALRGFLAVLCAGVLGCLFAAGALPDPAAQPESAAQARIEVRSASFLAVGLVRDDTLSIHLSRAADNAPVRDAVVTVILRGTERPTTAETDGSYSLHTADLGLPGSVSIEFKVKQGMTLENLKGSLQITAASDKPQEKNGARQLWWWALNFGVCIGFLLLISRRRKAAQN
jgi:hypothetical protein